MLGVSGPVARTLGRTEPELTYIWRRDPQSGSWRVARDSLPQNVEAWLKVFRETEPGVEFLSAKRRPSQ